MKVEQFSNLLPLKTVPEGRSLGRLLIKKSRFSFKIVLRALSWIAMGLLGFGLAGAKTPSRLMLRASVALPPLRPQAAFNATRRFFPLSRSVELDDSRAMQFFTSVPYLRQPCSINGTSVKVER